MDGIHVPPTPSAEKPLSDLLPWIAEHFQPEENSKDFGAGWFAQEPPVFVTNPVRAISEKHLLMCVYIS